MAECRNMGCLWPCPSWSFGGSDVELPGSDTMLLVDNY